MIYLKSALVGLAAMFVSVVVFWTGLTVMFTFILPRLGNTSGGGAVTFGPIFVVPILGVLLVIFALGFYWEFSRASGV